MRNFRYALVASFLFLMNVSEATPLVWQVVAPGIEYGRVMLPAEYEVGSLYAFRLDLKQVQLKIVFAKDRQQPYATAQEYAEYYHALLVINGGFFASDFASLGLRISEGRLKNALKPISWWGIFYIENNIPYVSSMQAFKSSPDITFAIQSGPRLVVDAKPLNLKRGVAERTAIGITKNNKVIIAVSKEVLLTLNELAAIMVKPSEQGGLGCWYALNLDGGTSTQLYANFPDLNLWIAGGKGIADAIIVLPKRKSE